MRCRNHEKNCDGVLLDEGNKHYICPKCRMGYVLTPIDRTNYQPKGRKK
jgi:hypothetical protein